MKVEYDSNNSGGGWWLSDDDWKNLEAAGWKVDWYKDQPDGIMHHQGEDRFLGALASRASREGLTLEEAIAEFERITSENAEAEGCECCGQPHNFYAFDDEGQMIW
jgi:hypothetical protein